MPAVTVEDRLNMALGQLEKSIKRDTFGPTVKSIKIGDMILPEEVERPPASSVFHRNIERYINTAKGCDTYMTLHAAVDLDDLIKARLEDMYEDNPERAVTLHQAVSNIALRMMARTLVDRCKCSSGGGV